MVSFTSTCVAAAAFVAAVSAQTPPGFVPKTMQKLGVKFENDIAVGCAGTWLRATETVKPPTLVAGKYFDTAPSYLAFMIDIDVEFNGQIIPLLHWYRADLVIDEATMELQNSTADEGAVYGGPQPPPGTTHRYLELLFRQPEDYKFPEKFEGFLEPTIPARLGFDINAFVEAAGLWAPIAGNYFTVSSPREYSAEEEEAILAKHGKEAGSRQREDLKR